MAEMKTKPTKISPTAFIKTVMDDRKRKDCRDLAALMQEITGEPPKMWGPSIVGFGKYHYRYESGREGDMMRIGFSPRSQNLTLYIGYGAEDQKLLAGLGKFKTGKGCLYIQSLDDIDRDLLRSLMKKSVEEMRLRYPE